MEISETDIEKKWQTKSLVVKCQINKYLLVENEWYSVELYKKHNRR